jgi:hypothetical protein
MPYSYDDIMKYQAERLTAQRAAAVADLESARYREDAYAVSDAADTILKLDGDLERLGRIANQHYSQQQAQQPRNRYGLSDAEVEVARGIAGSDPRLTNEQREEIYAREKQKLGYMRRTGQYRDDQGQVSR